MRNASSVRRAEERTAGVISMSDSLLRTIKTRRVIRNMNEKEVERGQIEKILESARWAPAAGNQRTNRFIVIQNYCGADRPLNITKLEEVKVLIYQYLRNIIRYCRRVAWDTSLQHLRLY